MKRVKTGYLGDTRDPKNKIGSDGLTHYQREYCQRNAELTQRNEARLRTKGWTKKLIQLADGSWEWITRDQWEAGQVPERKRVAPGVDIFEPAWYPHLGLGGSYVRTRAELKQLLHKYDQVQVG